MATRPEKISLRPPSLPGSSPLLSPLRSDPPDPPDPPEPPLLPGGGWLGLGVRRQGVRASHGLSDDLFECIPCSSNPGSGPRKDHN